MDWKEHKIEASEDGSFVVTLEGLPCRVSESGDLSALHAEVKAFAEAHPSRVEREEAFCHEPSREEMAAGFAWVIQQRLDNFARSEGRAYDNMVSLCSYATSTNPVFAREGKYGVEARDATWEAANKLMSAVLAGERIFSTKEELEAELPVLKWPESVKS